MSFDLFCENVLAFLPVELSDGASSRTAARGWDLMIQSLNNNRKSCAKLLTHYLDFLFFFPSLMQYVHFPLRKNRLCFQMCIWLCALTMHSSLIISPPPQSGKFFLLHGKTFLMTVRPSFRSKTVISAQVRRMVGEWRVHLLKKKNPIQTYSVASVASTVHSSESDPR